MTFQIIYLKSRYLESLGINLPSALSSKMNTIKHDLKQGYKTMFGRPGGFGSLEKILSHCGLSLHDAKIDTPSRSVLFSLPLSHIPFLNTLLYHYIQLPLTYKHTTSQSISLCPNPSLGSSQKHPLSLLFSRTHNFCLLSLCQVLTTSLSVCMYPCMCVCLYVCGVCVFMCVSTQRRAGRGVVQAPLCL